MCRLYFLQSTRIMGGRYRYFVGMPQGAQWYSAVAVSLDDISRNKGSTKSKTMSDENS